MKHFFMQTNFLVRIVIFAFILWFFSFYFLLFVLVICLIFILFLFRKKNINLNEKSTFDSNILCSPVSGKITSIEENESHKIVTIKSQLCSGYGVYLPLSSTISTLEIEKAHSRVIISDDDVDIHLSLFSFFKRFPSILFVGNGDRGVIGANIGYLPFGGKTVIDLPKTSKILVKNGDKVESFQTLLADLKVEK